MTRRLDRPWRKEGGQHQLPGILMLILTVSSLRNDRMVGRSAFAGLPASCKKVAYTNAMFPHCHWQCQVQADFETRSQGLECLVAL